MGFYERIFQNFGRKLDEGGLNDQQKNEAFAQLAETFICKVAGMSAEEFCEDNEWEPAMKVAFRCDNEDAILRALEHPGDRAELAHAIATTMGMSEPQMRFELIATIESVSNGEAVRSNGAFVPTGTKVTD